MDGTRLRKEFGEHGWFEGTVVGKKGEYYQIEYDDERLCGGHAFSVDGRNWTFTGTAWSNVVEFTDGSSYIFSRRERPHLVFGDSRDPFRISALTTGVQYGTGSPVALPGEDACYTLYQPVAQ